MHPAVLRSLCSLQAIVRIEYINEHKDTIKPILTPLLRYNSHTK